MRLLGRFTVSEVLGAEEARLRFMRKGPAEQWPSGSARCGRVPAAQGRSGVFAAQTCTWESQTSIEGSCLVDSGFFDDARPLLRLGPDDVNS
jgi:hypothetical protein